MHTRLLAVAVLVVALVVIFTSSVFAQGGPAPVSDLMAEISGTSVVLTWTHGNGAVNHYEVWWADSPYGLPGDAGVVRLADVTPGTVGQPVAYTDTASGVGNPGVNSYYFLRGMSATGEVTEPSNRVGEFDYGVSDEEQVLPVVDHCGTINADEIWGPTSVHRLTCDITVASNIELVVLPGTVVKPQATSVGLRVNGTLNVQGSPDHPVYITSYRDDTVGGDTNGDGGASTAAKGDWEGIYVASTGLVEMIYTTLRFGGDTASTYDAIVYLFDNAVGSFDWVTVAESEYRGIYAYASNSGTTTSLTFSNGIVEDNQNTGIHAARGSGTGLNVSVTDSTICDNGSYGFYMQYANGVELAGNTFTGNGGTAAYLSFSDGSFTSLAGNSGTNNAQNGIHMAGSLATDTTLPVNAGLPYITNNLRINAGATLTLPAGSVVKVTSLGGLTVDGTLLVQGIATNSVTFTSLKDDSVGGDTNNDGDATTPEKGDWREISVSSGATAVFDYAVIRYGGYGQDIYNSYISGNIRASGDNWTLTLRHSTVSHSRNAGIWAHKGFYPDPIPLWTGCSLTVTDSTITDNGAGGSGENPHGIIYWCDGNLTVTDSYIIGNPGDGINGSYGRYDLSGSEMSANGGSGVSLISPGLFAIVDNTVENNGSDAIRLSLDELTGTPELSGNSLSGNEIDGVVLSGNVMTTTLPADPGGSYVVDGLRVKPNGVLTLLAGTTFKFPSYMDLTVDGYLEVQGTTDNPVVFTSVSDDSVGGDTNNDGDATTPEKGDWRAISVSSGATAVFDYAVIRYGGYGQDIYNSYISGNIRASGDNWTLTLRHSTISHSRNAGIWAHKGFYPDPIPLWTGCSLTVTDSTITDNGTGGSRENPHGIMYWCDGVFEVHSNRIFNNHGHGIHNDTPDLPVTAEYNWWGSDSGPAPFGSGNGINYDTCWDPVNKINYVCHFHVDADPWIGQAGGYGRSVPWQVHDGDPVNTANGNYAYQRTEVSIPTRGLPLEFTRSYNSLSPVDGPLGWGWRHNWMVTAEENGDEVRITYGGGRQIRFTRDGDSYVGDPGVFSTLQKIAGTFHLTEKDQTIYHFDSLGRLESVEDKNGNTTTLSYLGNTLDQVIGPSGRALDFTYDGNLRLGHVQDPIGRTIDFTYNITGELTSLVDVTGQTTAYTYDADHRLLIMTDANSHTFLTNEYNDFGRVERQLDAQGNPTTFAYDEPNRRTIVTNPLGNSTTYQYDPDLRLVTETDAMNQTESYVYDAANNRIQVTDRRSYSTLYGYDERGNTIVVTDSVGYTTTMTYDSRNNLLSRTDERGNTTTYAYDANSNLIQRTDPHANTATRTYDAHGQLTSSTDENGHTTTFGYDDDGNRTSVTDALGNTTTMVYDLAGRLESETDALGRTTSYTHDAANRVLSISEPMGKITSFAYDAVGNRISITDPRLGITSFSYDEKDRLVNITDPLDHTTVFAYDATNNRISVTDPLSHTTAFAYDELDRRASTSDSLGNTTSYGYDPNGNRTSLTDANNNTTSYTYDALNRLETVTDAEGGTVSYAYDPVGNRVSMTDANNNTTSYTYDALNRLETVTDPLEHVVLYGYDFVNNRTSKTKADSVVINYVYDEADRLEEINYPGGIILYAYDAVGNRLVMTDTVGVTTYEYDDLDRLTSASGPNGALSYGYDLSNNRTSIEYPGNDTVVYTYDPADRLKTVTDWAGRTTTYTYDDAGRQIETDYPNGVQATYTYDEVDRLLGITHNSPVSGTIAFSDYTLDNVGNRLTMEDPEGTATYTYDDLYRLTAVAYPDGEQVAYTYDPMGNRLSMDSTVHGLTTYSYDAGDRLLSFTDPSATTTLLAWDDNGNMIGKGTAVYTFDPLDRLTQVVTGTTSVQFSYDGDGVRVGKSVDGVQIVYAQDVASPLPVLLVEIEAGQPNRYLSAYELVTVEESSADSLFYHTDGLGNTRALSDLAGQYTDEYHYEVFGGNRLHIGGAAQPFTFAGEQKDEDVGLVYLRTRYYEPSTGRFITRDRYSGFPAYSQSLNSYTYVYNNPISGVDPTGMTSISDQLNLLELAADIDELAQLGLELTAVGFGITGMELAVNSMALERAQKEYYACWANPGCSKTTTLELRRRYSDAELQQIIDMVPIVGPLFGLARNHSQAFEQWWDRFLDKYERWKYHDNNIQTYGPAWSLGPPSQDEKERMSEE